MKKLTVLLPDDASVDLSALLAAAVEVHLEAVPEAAPAKRKRSARVRKEGWTAPDAIMQHYSPESTFALDLAGQWLEAEGYSATSASACLSKLVKQGRLARASSGLFRFVTQNEVKLVGGGD
jgi:hypothetical protein